MKTFHCDSCGQAVFFENVQCLNCGRTLGFLQDLDIISALEPDGENWRALAQQDKDNNRYRMCQNYSQENVCNWMIPVAESEPFCQSCRFNQTIPDLSQMQNRVCWVQLEAAKRRLIYTLKVLDLPLANKYDDPDNGLAFDFLADPDSDFSENEKVMTGHANGLITINIAEADDAVREKLRLDLNERYRTVLGHFRHEIGHYYWDRLICDDDSRLESFRALFGDEREDYAGALKQHYEKGPPENWPIRFVSTYASSHPWEDWAETWAHYLHMVDTLETAADFNLKVRPPHSTRKGSKEVKPALALNGNNPRAFDAMLKNWLALTYAINSINRSMGLKDLYPFVLSELVIDKLRFVHTVIVREDGS